VIAATVHEIVRKRVAHSLPPGPLAGELRLGGEGLGLDSISIAEVLLECEQRFGVGVTQLLEGEPLTLARLIEHVERATAR